MSEEEESREKELSLTTAASSSVILSKQEEEGKIQKLEHHNQNELEVNSKNKLYIVTSGLQKYIYKQLVEQISKENCVTIADYIMMQKTEVNLAGTYRANIMTTLISLSKLLDNKPFKTMTRDDILYYLDVLPDCDNSLTLVSRSTTMACSGLGLVLDFDLGSLLVERASVVNLIISFAVVSS